MSLVKVFVKRPVSIPTGDGKNRQDLKVGVNHIDSDVLKSDNWYIKSLVESNIISVSNTKIKKAQDNYRSQEQIDAKKRMELSPKEVIGKVKVEIAEEANAEEKPAEKPAEKPVKTKKSGTTKK